MTYLQSRQQSRPRRPSHFTSNPIFHKDMQTNDAYFAALAPALAVAAGLALSLLARVCTAFEDYVRSNCDRNTKKFKLVMLAMVLFMTALPGTREEKTEFLARVFEKLYAKRLARQEELHGKYLVWRQRKCWMWGGGLRAGLLAASADVFVAANDLNSYDALIPT